MNLALLTGVVVVAAWLGDSPQTLPQTALDQLRQAIRLNRSLGFMTREISPGEVVAYQPGEAGAVTLKRAAEDGLGQTFVTFDQDWKLIRIRNETNRRLSGTATLSPQEREAKCLEFLKGMSWLKPNEFVKVTVQIRAVTDLFVHVKRGDLLEYLPAQFTFQGDFLKEAWIYPRLPNIEHNLSQPRLDKETLVARALGYYAEFRPMPEAEVKVLPMFIGFPILSLNHEDPPLTSLLEEDLKLKRPFPFLAVSLSFPGSSEGSPRHLVFVDARSGALYSYVASGGGLGGSGQSKTASSLNLARVTIGRVTGKLTQTKAESATRPVGRTCLVRSGNLVYLGTLDNRGRIWLKAGGEPWRAYKPDAKLMKALKAIPKAAANRAISQAKACGPRMQTEVCAPIQTEVCAPKRRDRERNLPQQG